MYTAARNVGLLSLVQGPCSAAPKPEFAPNESRFAAGDPSGVEARLTGREGGTHSGFDLKWLVEDFQVALTQELDFTLEAKHAERARKMFAHRADVKVKLANTNAP